MPQLTPDILSKINSFPKLVGVLRDYLDWPIREDMELDEVVYDWDAAELGLKPDEIVKIREIKQLRPLVTNQPWGVFFISFEAKTLSVTVLRRLLRSLVVKKRAVAGAAERQAWDKNDLMFAANFGTSGQRELAFIHFSDEGKTNDLPLMKVLGWNARDTVLHNVHASQLLSSKLRWPDNTRDSDTWRKNWASAFEVGHNQVIDDSKKLAAALAGLAQNIRARVNELLGAETEQGSMQKMLAAFRKNLIQDLDEDGFADMFAQTIAYGLLAAHISRPSAGLVADNLVDMVPRTNPFLRELFSTFLSLGGRDSRKKMDFDELGVRDVVDMLARADMEAVLRDFGNRNPKKDPVIHFYEDFLKEYDAAQKIDAGIFYTPPAVVNFIVRGVDEMLRTELDLPLGLADTTTWGELARRSDKIIIPAHVRPDQPFVQILDVATGTGTFLVEVIDLIHKTMLAHWRSQGLKEAELKRAWNAYVPQNLLPRLTGFELKMAPYAIAHMKLGLKLVATDYSFASDERAHVLLTNALQPHLDLDYAFGFMKDAFAHEAERANDAKDQTAFTVVIGNPPYKGHSENPSRSKKGQLTHAGKLIRRFFQVRGQPLGEKNPKWLNNDYVKFLALGLACIEKSGFGALGMITSNSWLDSPTFRGVRTEFIDAFGSLRLIDLHGNINKREIAPDGSRDEGVFAIEEGTNITLAARTGAMSNIRQLDLLGAVGEGLPGPGKLAWLEANSLPAIQNTLHPLPPFFLLTPMHSTKDGKNHLQAEFYSFADLKGKMAVNSAGIATGNDDLTVQFTADEMERTAAEFRRIDLAPLLAERDRKGGSSNWRLEASANPLKIDVIERSEPRDWQVEYAQRELKALENLRSHLHAVSYRPFDVRSTIFTGNSRGFQCMPRPEVMSHMLGGGNLGLSTTRGFEVKRGWEHVFVFDQLIQHHSVSLKEVNYLFPLWLKPSAGEVQRRPNIDRIFAQHFGKAVGLTYDDGIRRGEQQSFGAEYRKQRPQQVSLLDAAWDGRGDLSKAFGPRDLFDYIYAILHAPSYRTRYAEFLKSDFPHVPTPVTHDLFQELVRQGKQLVALHLLKPEEAPILKKPDIRYVGKANPQIGKKRTSKGGFPQWVNGKVMINEAAWFEDVPRETFEFQIGGYKPASKWIEDRAAQGGKKPTPGRILTEDDILHYRRVVVALTETRRIMAEIDKVIEAHGGWPGAFGGPGGETE